jgi:mannose-6-phosphate isomerase-like protein (cupin superfamily)
VPFVDPAAMLHATPLPGWHGRFFHSDTMTFSHYDIAADAAPLHEHHHPQEEVWHVVDGEVLLTIDGVEQAVHAGGVAVVPPDTPHSVRIRGACRVIVADHPVRSELPGGLRAPTF